MSTVVVQVPLYTSRRIVIFSLTFSRALPLDYYFVNILADAYIRVIVYQAAAVHELVKSSAQEKSRRVFHILAYFSNTGVSEGRCQNSWQLTKGIRILMLTLRRIYSFIEAYTGHSIGGRLFLGIRTAVQ